MSTDIFDKNVVMGMKLAAIEAGRYLGRIFAKQEELRPSGVVALEAAEKSDGGVPDFVTQHDVHAEQLVRQVINIYVPGLGVVGEEGEKDMSKDSYILVDPCDGTKNFALGIPYFAVSIAYIKGGEIVSGVVCDPANMNIYWAAKGDGAFLEKKGAREPLRIHASQETNPRNIFLVAEESYGDAIAQEAAINRLVTLAPVFSGFRKFGSTALDLARLAAGQPIVVIASGIKSWDFSAGAIIAQEAGAFLSDFQGKSLSVNSGELIASPTRPINDLLYKVMVSAMGKRNQREVS